MDITHTVKVVSCVPLSSVRVIHSGQIVNPSYVRVGHWRMVCCESDLERIKSNSMMKETKDSMDSYDGFYYEVFRTKKHAVQSLKHEKATKA